MSNHFAFGLAIAATVVASACAHSSRSADGPSAGSNNESTIQWSPSLELRSLSMIDKRLDDRFADPYDVVRVGGNSDAPNKQVMTNCADYFVLQPKGYQPVGDVDAAALKVEGAKCQVVRALRSAKTPAHGTPLVLTKDALSALPAVVAPAPGPSDIKKRDAASRTNTSWRSYDSSTSMSVTDDFRARVAAADSITDLEILAQADFDGDGSEDTLLLSVSGGTKGTWREVHLRLLTHIETGPVFQVVKELPL